MSFLHDPLLIVCARTCRKEEEEGRGGGYGSTTLTKDPTTQAFLDGLSLFLLQYQDRKDMEEDRLPSSYYSTTNIHPRVPACNMIQMGRAFFSFVSKSISTTASLGTS